MKKKLIAVMLVLAMTLALGGMEASAETAKHERVYVQDKNEDRLYTEAGVRPIWKWKSYCFS